MAGASVVAVQRSSLDASETAGDGLIAIPRVSKFPSVASGICRQQQPPHHHHHHHQQQEAALGLGDAPGLQVATEHVAEPAVTLAASGAPPPPAGSAGSGAADINPAAEDCAVSDPAHPEAARGSAAGGGCGPPGWVVRGLAARLRHSTGLQLFNFDLLCPTTPGAPPLPCC